MKRAAFVGLVGSVFLLTANCQQSGPGGSEASGGSGGTTTGAGGTGGTNESGGSGGSGGTSGSGGSTSSGGTTGSGGSSGEGGGAGGTDENGGSSGNGGDTAPGGAGGKMTGGSTTARGGSGGTTPAGGTTGSGGANAGGTTTARGGATGSGGATANTGGATTATGGTTGSGGSTTNLAATVVPDLAKGFYWEGTCGGTIVPTGHNCPMTGTGETCPPNGRDIDKSLKVGGESNKKYTVTIEVRGVIGTRCYQGGTPASTATIKEDDYNNWWYVGGQPYNATGWWNTYELRVSPSTGDKDVYFFNNVSNTAASGPPCESEASYLVGYTASFKVMGGGTMLFRIHDNNCKAMQNCGKSINGNDPCAPRTVDLSKMSVQPPATSPAANQPPKNDNKWYPQWMWIVATKVDPA